MTNRRPVFLAAILAICCAPQTHADNFGAGANSFSIDFVTVGNPGNPSYGVNNQIGAVPYIYRIGKYEISEQMIDNANVLGGLGITKDTRGPDKPATSVTWYEAAKFVNWLNTSTGNAPAYKFDAGGNFQLWAIGDPGYDVNNLYRNSRAKYVLPSFNEWFKAAYYDPVAGVYYDYPTRSNAVPDGIDFVGDPIFDAVFDDGAENPEPNVITDVGILGPYETAGQGGNVFEWDETAFDLTNNSPNESRGLLGGTWTGPSSLILATNFTGLAPFNNLENIGFRVAVRIPEPDGSMLIYASAIGFLAVRIRSRSNRR